MTTSKKVAVIDDIVSYGKCSLGISIPVLSSVKIDVYPAITAIYSAHTAVDNYSKLETGQIFNDSLKNWGTQKISFDAIQTGSLSSKDQAYACLELFANQAKAIKIVDPVLGDFGDFYDDNFKALLPHVKKLCSKADIITPNLTEAQLLTGLDSEEPKVLLDALSKIGAKNIILTGVSNKNIIKNYVLNNDTLSIIESQFYDYLIHGAGDLFLSCIIAALMCNYELQTSVDFASKTTSNTVKETIMQEGFENRGINFELAIQNIIKSLNKQQ